MNTTLRTFSLLALLGSSALLGCVPMNAGTYSSSDSYSSDPYYGGYRSSDSRYDDPYYRGGYDSYREERLEREQERTRRERQRLEWERDRVERERDRLARDRERERERQREFERAREREQHEAQRPNPMPLPHVDENRCPPGFNPRSEKCSDKERKRGCRDIRRMPNGMYCVDL